MIKQKIHKQIIPMIFFILLIIYTISLIIPLIWTILTSLKSQMDFYLNPFKLPSKPMFENYLLVFKDMYREIMTPSGPRKVFLIELFFNSILYSVGCTFISILVQSTSAYVCAKYRFKFGRIIHSTVILVMIFPIVGSLPSELQIMRAIGFYDNLIGMWLIKGSFTGLNFLIFYATFKGISWEYAEAAVIDGASHAAIMFKIMLPLAKVTIFSLGILSFITYWNDWQVSVIYLPNTPVAAYALYAFQFNTSNISTGVPFVMAACLMVMLPIFILFMAFKNKLIGSLSMGGLKG